MAYSVRLMPRAAEDAECVYRRVVQEAPLQGQHWYNRLVEAIESLRLFPERCEAVESLSRSGITVRKLLYGHKPNTYRIYFAIDGKIVRILHIRHGARREPTPGDIRG